MTTSAQKIEKFHFIARNKKGRKAKVHSRSLLGEICGEYQPL